MYITIYSSYARSVNERFCAAILKATLHNSQLTGWSQHAQVEALQKKEEVDPKSQEMKDLVAALKSSHYAACCEMQEIRP